MHRMVDTWECVVVGAGPAGLSAALYMARFRRRVLVLHDGSSRALRIPRTHNVPGFPDGVEGPALVERMIGHATRYGAQVREAVVVSARHDDGLFELRTGEGTQVNAEALVLATGLYLNEPPLPHDVLEAAIEAGVLRYCPVCDGFEHTGRRIAVLGCDASGADEALFLRQYSDDVTLVPMDMPELSAAKREELVAAGVTVETRPVARLSPRDDRMDIHLHGVDEPTSFSVVYPALGTRQRTELAAMLGLRLDEAGAVDAHAPLGTAVPGLYCAGDIVDGLDQISVAVGHGAIAATRAHNWLSKRSAISPSSSAARRPRARDRAGRSW